MRRAATSRTSDGSPEEALAAVRSNRSKERRNFPPVPSPPEEDSGGAPGALRGSDVLHALQRAVAKREARKLSGKKKRKRATADGIGDGAALDHSEQVRPIEIRSDWGQRIDELEKRIQELRSQYH
ncbi:hypothetical protein Cni_G03905 [Canna indica]|uniref:Uncharacterized protein n=1 Tax=Canna indica TaxID=4628 RepID=A0AAQ3Q293_9LILI|nr:hypothetical protein Cni_G03905 [Canna indica]